jgi:hypothetical protein
MKWPIQADGLAGSQSPADRPALTGDDGTTVVVRRAFEAGKGK